MDVIDTINAEDLCAEFQSIAQVEYEKMASHDRPFPKARLPGNIPIFPFKLNAAL